MVAPLLSEVTECRGFDVIKAPRMSLHRLYLFSHSLLFSLLFYLCMARQRLSRPDMR
jgi:hypothetical protein